MRKRRLTAAVLASVLMLPLLFSACKTAEAEKITEYRIPDLSFPEPPALEWVYTGEDGKSVTVPIEWFLNVAKYAIDVQAVEQELSELRAGLQADEQ